MLWNALYEAFGMGVKGDKEAVLPLLSDGVCLMVMDVGRSHEAKGTVVMVVIVPDEEVFGPVPCLFDGLEALREGVMVFQGFELGLRVRVVVRQMRS